MQLINTIEINPYDYMDSDDPKLSGIPEGRSEFWTACISHRGLGRLKAIKNGSYLVDLTTINDAELEEILKNELEDVDMGEYDDQVGRLCGGVVLSMEDRVYIAPNCCGDIGDLAGWEAIGEETAGEWKMLWIGHPWVYYRIQGEMVEFSDYTEGIENLSIMLTVAKAELMAEVEKVREEQDRFEDQLQRVLDRMGIENSKEIARIMTGNV